MKRIEAAAAAARAAGTGVVLTARTENFVRNRPDLRDVPIIVPHFGAGYFREALMLAELCPNVYLDTSSSNDWMRFQTPPMQMRDVFRQALDILGSSRLLFGTDSSFFPRGWNHPVFDAQSTALYELGVNAHDARAIFGENLLRILNR